MSIKQEKLNSKKSTKKKHAILLVIRNRRLFTRINNLLKKIKSSQFIITHSSTISDAIEQTKKDSFDVVLIDLNLQAKANTASLQKLLNVYTTGPIVAIINNENSALEDKCLHIGAQDVLDSKRITAKGLWRTIHHSCERFHSTAALQLEHTLLQHMANSVDEVDYSHFDISGILAAKNINNQIVSKNLHLLNKIRKQKTMLNYIAHHDALTDLPNRIHFETELDQTVSNSSRHEHKFSVFMIDLDGFKNVNDQHGHAVGDQLLHTAGQRIKKCLRGEDFLARIGGDEFAVICKEIRSEKDAGIIAKKITKSLRRAFKNVGDTKIKISASVGISCFPKDASKANELTQKADQAMYNAKQAGKNQYQYLSASLHQQHLELLKSI